MNRILKEYVCLNTLLFKVAQAFHSLRDSYSQTSFYKCYYNLTKYIFTFILH